MPTNNQEKWIDKLTDLVEKEAYCLQGKDCYMDEIIDLVRQEIRQAKIEGLEEAKAINEKERQLTWKFFHECQLWEEQKSAIASLASLDHANEKIDQAISNLQKQNGNTTKN